MSIIIGFCIFCLVLFFYIHIQFHLKTGEDLEMYEVDEITKDRLEEICDLRQPVLFDFDCQTIMNATNRDYIANNHSAFEIKIRNVRENNKNAELYMPLPLHAAIKLFNEDKTASYLTENNTEFLQETGVKKDLQYNDEFLRPYMVSNCNYDILMGSAQVCTPFRYEINYRNYLLLTQGSAQIKMTCPKNIKYLNPEYDYENFEFRSPINTWNPQPNYKADFDKIKCLEFTLLPGKTLYIPAYWFYSIKFNENSSITVFNYRTYLNNVAIAPYIGLHFLQLQNIKRETVTKIDINKLNEPLKETCVVETPIVNEEPTSLDDKIVPDKIDDDANIVIERQQSTNIDDLPSS
jgi:hypothetical protein